MFVIAEHHLRVIETYNPKFDRGQNVWIFNSPNRIQQLKLKNGEPGFLSREESTLHIIQSSLNTM